VAIIFDFWDATGTRRSQPSGVRVSLLFRIRLFPSRLMRRATQLYRRMWPKLPRFPSRSTLFPVDDNAFHQRLLAAVEKPRTGRLLTILNSSFFLWILTACVVSAGGVYVTSYQQCRKDADDEIERNTKIERELFQRELKIREIIMTRLSVADMRAALLQPNFYYPEFSGFPNQILRESDASFLNRVKDLKIPSHQDIPRNELLNLFQVSNGRIPDNLTDKDIKLLQEYAQKMLAQARPIPLPGFGLSPFEAACGPRTLLDRFFSGASVRIVRAYHKPELPRVLPVPDPGAFPK
jgi:hypothetical protein